MSGSSRRLARFLDAQGHLQLGVVEGEHLQPVRGDLFGALRLLGERVSLSTITLLPPVRPAVLAVVDAAGGLSLKPPSAVIGAGDHIRLPAGRAVAYPCRAAVIRRTLSAGTAPQSGHLLGETLLSDVVAEGSPLGGMCDTFAPLGPWIREGCGEDLVAAVARVSAGITLSPGDVVALRVGPPVPLEKGGTCRAEIPGLGVLQNPVGVGNE